MRLLVLSDIHGNRFGLEAVFEAARGQYDALLCLGDVVGYGAHPNECCEMLREAKAECLSGNHDAAALGLIDLSWFNDAAAAAALWTRRELSEANTKWLRALPGAREFPEWNLQAVHGSLRQPWEEYILDVPTAAATMRLMSCELCFFGHTHRSIAYCAEIDDAESRWLDFEEAALPDGGEFELEPGWRFLVNPGSCGQPRDGNRQARYAILDSETATISIMAIDYDWNAARRAIHDAGLPRELGDRLLRGR